ncbi:MAG: right-handed parallel beta-helix repeat-containing protein [Thermoplasmatales archaeon]|nr:right-handed parallel beta-helix repeat-containing protein [Thermoplasmatales archaeon]
MGNNSLLQMKKAITFATIIIMLGMFFSCLTAGTISATEETKIPLKQDLVEHSPICIRSNSDFTVANGVSSGSGTESDPYIIEGWDINVSTASGIEVEGMGSTSFLIGIYIENTDAHFVIRDCCFRDGMYERDYANNGIYFFNVTNGKIQNVTIYNNHDGITFCDSPDKIITNCYIHNNSYGISIGSWSGTSNNNIISNSTFHDSQSGITIESSNNQIINCTFYNNSKHGISLASSAFPYNCINNTVANCLIHDSGDGIYLACCSNNQINNCIIYDTIGWGGMYDSGNGIYLYRSFWNTIINCTSYNNSWIGIYSDDTSNNNQIINCTTYNNPGGGIKFSESSNITIVNSTIYNNCYWGIWVGISSNVTIKNCTIYGNSWQGISTGSNNATIADCDIFQNGYGLNIYSSDVYISNCEIYNNSNHGIYFSGSNNSLINCNIHGNNGTGIDVSGSSNTISNCNVYNNNVDGIRMNYSPNNTITNCNIYNNTGDGIYSGYYSSNNVVHHCNIYNNTDYGISNYYSESKYAVNATYCWWGATDGPFGEDANPVGGAVVYEPWLTKMLIEPYSEVIVTLLSPILSDTWTGGSVHSIKYNIAHGLPPYNIAIAYSIDDWATYQGIATTTQIKNGTYNYSWLLPSIDSSTVKVRVKTVDDVGIETFDTSGNFEIDSTEPYIITYTGTYIATTEPIMIVFSEEMNHESAESAFSLKDSSGNPVNGTFSWDGNVMDFVPNETLTSNMDYNVTVNTSAKDVSDPGNNLTSNVSWKLIAVEGRGDFVVDLDVPSSPEKGKTYTIMVAVHNTGDEAFGMSGGLTAKFYASRDGEVWTLIDTEYTSGIRAGNSCCIPITFAFDDYGEYYFLAEVTSNNPVDTFPGGEKTGRVSASVNIPEPQINQAPTLSDGTATPSSGKTTITFTFTVTYTDPENDPPTVKKVYIDGIAHDMSSPDTNYTDGAVFTYSTTLSKGTHTYYFEFSDGTTITLLPATGANTGPSVTEKKQEKALIPSFELIYLISALSLVLIFKRRKRI